MSRPIPPPRMLAGLAVVAVLAFALPAQVAAHAELEASSPADGASVPSPFNGPILLSFSATLADGSKADLVGPDGAVVASATVDGPDATMTIALGGPLPAGAYDVRWVSVADDGDLERGTISFTVAPATATSSSTQTTATQTVATQTTAPASAAVQTTAPVPPTAAASPSASPAGDATGSGSADVILPIVVALVVVGAGALYLLGRRNRPTTSR